MPIYNRKLHFSTIWAFTSILLGLVFATFYFFYSTPQNTRSSTILGGLATGLAIALVQLLLSWYEYKEIEKFKKMEVVDILSNRDDRQYYEKIIIKAKKKIDIMGVTASRFIDDFADINSDRNTNRVLLEAMSRSVKVRILLPANEFLIEQKQKNDAQHVGLALAALQKQYGDKLEFRYFSHAPVQSIFIFDSQCILGPVFPNISSKDTPAIVIKNTSPFASRYLDYFENEWANSK